ncbi:MAG: glycoside hydrolase family 38, partial [Cephaloticoccus sp.]|nr:glycoside hydrolase family 38 [Cephaloticoccus sp.]
GRALVRELGAEPSSAGFLCDMFGHTGQMPQILRGFGIKVAFVWRGVEPRAAAHFHWRAPDGTAVLTHRFGRAGYCDYTYDVRRSTQFEVPFEEARARRDLDAHLAKEAGRTRVPPMLLFDGGDHRQPDADHYRVLFERGPSREFPYAIRHTSLDDYAAELLKHAAKVKDEVTGELRETGGSPPIKDLQWYIPGVLSSRVNLKQANVACEALLCQWAEPFAALASRALAAEYPDAYLRAAWRWLLTNHPHDSIDGCSVDEVHRDMLYRFAQCRQIATGQSEDSLRLIARAAAGEVPAGELRVLVANPLACPVDEIVELTLDLPVDWAEYNEFFGFEPKPAFRLYDGATGREIPYQLLAQRPRRSRRRLRTLKYPELFRVNEVVVAVRLSLPATGYAILAVREGEKAPADEILPALPLPTRHPAAPGLATSDRSMENEHLRVVIDGQGGLTLTDRRSGLEFSRLLTFEDMADIGDGWYHGPPVNDAAVTSAASHAEVSLLHDGPAQCAFRIRTHLTVPAAYDPALPGRVESRVELVCDSTVTLRAGADRVEVKTVVDNHARDHRLRVLFPTGIPADTYYSDAAFDVVERPVALPTDNHLRRELAVETAPQQTWTAVAGPKGGLAVVATGLHESAVRDQAARPIALTLFRATGRTIFTDGQPDGQLQGRLEFNYWIVPFAGAVPRARLTRCGQQLAGGHRLVQLTALERETIPAGPGALPPRGGLIAVEGEVVCTSIRQIDGALEVRLFNPATRAQTARLTAGKAAGRGWRSVCPVDLESRPVGPAKPWRGASLRWTVRAKQIVTLSLRPED